MTESEAIKVSDKEKRILLSALAREKEVCVEVDKLCDSLEYKFYYDRLFKQIEKQIRTEAIDECLEIVKSYRNDWDGIEWAIREIDELKAGVNNGK